MIDANELLGAIKKAALDAVDASKPVNICFGTVQSVSPLQIDLEQKLPLSDKQLIVCKHLTNYSVMVTDPVEGAATNRTVTINNALAVGDRVVLIRQQEGQKYLVVDRL